MSDAAEFRMLGAKQAQVAGATEADTSAAEGAGKVVGGILGALVGTYFGGPAGGAAGSALGAQAGGGVGKIFGGGDVEEGVKQALVPDLDTLSSAARVAGAKAASGGGSTGSMTDHLPLGE